MNEQTEHNRFRDAANAQKQELKPSPSLAADAMYRTSMVVASLLGGIAQSFASSFGEFADKLSPNNITKMGVSNGLWEGLAAGNARFFEELAKTSRTTTEICRQTSVAELEPLIDYDVLSKMVAEEMRKSQPKKTS